MNPTGHIKRFCLIKGCDLCSQVALENPSPAMHRGLRVTKTTATGLKAGENLFNHCSLKPALKLQLFGYRKQFSTAKQKRQILINYLKFNHMATKSRRFPRWPCRLFIPRQLVLRRSNLLKFGGRHQEPMLVGFPAAAQGLCWGKVEVGRRVPSSAGETQRGPSAPTNSQRSDSSRRIRE